MLQLDDFISFRIDAEAALRDFHERGFHIERNLVPVEFCDRLVEASAGLPPARDNSWRPAMMPHREDPIYLEAMRQPAVVSIMRRLIGPEVSGLQSELFYCRPGTKGFAIHQDNFFVEAPDNCFASAWMALTDVTADMGALVAYPGSHRFGRLATRALTGGSGEGQDPNAYNEETVLPDGIADAAVTVALPKGAVLFLNGWVAHSSGVNRSDQNRYALLCTYLRKGMPFRAGNTARREEVELSAA